VVQAVARDPSPDEEGSSSSGCTFNTNVAEEVSGSTGIPLGSFEAARTPATPVESSCPNKNEAFLVATGFTLDFGDDVDNSSGDAGCLLVPDVAANIDAGAGNTSETDGISLASGSTSVTDTTERASVTSGVLTDVVAAEAVSASPAVPRDVNIVEPVSAFAVISAPAKDEELSASDITSTTAPVEESSRRPPLSHHVYSERWSALGPVSVEESP
jgi:hypothetical protein